MPRPCSMWTTSVFLSILPGKQALHKRLQKLERVRRGATLSLSARMGAAPAVRSVHLASRTLSSGDQGPSPLCCPLHPVLSPSHAQAWDPQSCCPESPLAVVHGSSRSHTQRGHLQHPTPAAPLSRWHLPQHLKSYHAQHLSVDSTSPGIPKAACPAPLGDGACPTSQRPSCPAPLSDGTCPASQSHHAQHLSVMAPGLHLKGIMPSIFQRWHLPQHPKVTMPSTFQRWHLPWHPKGIMPSTSQRWHLPQNLEFIMPSTSQRMAPASASHRHHAPVPLSGRLPYPREG